MIGILVQSNFYFHGDVEKMKEFVKKSFLEKMNVWRIPGEGLYLHTFDGWLGGVEKHHSNSNQIRILNRQLAQKKLKVENKNRADDVTDLIAHQGKVEDLVKKAAGETEEKLGDLRSHEERDRERFFKDFLFPELVDPIPEAGAEGYGPHEQAFQDWFDVKL